MIVANIAFLALAQSSSVKVDLTGPLTAYRATPSVVTQIMLRKGGADDEGKGGTNKQKGWSTVGEQRGLGVTLSLAVAKQDRDTARDTFDAIEKTFAQMKSDGTWRNNPETERSKVAANSGWLESSVPAIAQLAKWDSAYAGRVEALKPKVRLAAEYMYRNRETLAENDDIAANRLLASASAFTSIAGFLNDPKFLGAADDLLSHALSKQQSSGIFEEHGGGDTSYQAVSLRNLAKIYLMRPTPELKASFKKAADWWLLRFTPDGKLDVRGNTRTAVGKGAIPDRITAKGRIREGREAKSGNHPTQLSLTLAFVTSVYPESKASALLPKFMGLAFRGDRQAPVGNYLIGAVD